jgi:hypothetical protein
MPAEGTDAVLLSGLRDLRPLVPIPSTPRLITLLRLFLIGRAAIVAGNLFLRKQLSLFQERKVSPRKASASTRLSMLVLARFFDSQVPYEILDQPSSTSDAQCEAAEVQVSRQRLA